MRVQRSGFGVDLTYCAVKWRLAKPIKQKKWVVVEAERHEGEPEAAGTENMR